MRRTLPHMVPCLYRSWQGATKPLSLSQQDISNIIRFICHRGMLLTWHAEHMVTQSYLLHFFLFPKASANILTKLLALILIYLFTARRKHRQTVAYQTFCRQMYHSCLAHVFNPLKAGMTTPESILCPDGHWRQAVYGLGPYIADYPEQVWLSGIVQGWCPK